MNNVVVGIAAGNGVKKAGHTKNKVLKMYAYQNFLLWLNKKVCTPIDSEERPVLGCRELGVVPAMQRKGGGEEK